MLPNKKYSDPRLRFQQSKFRKELQKARNYKRPTFKEAKNRIDELLTNIGLRSWKSRLGVFLVLFTLLYIVYVPNFLKVKNIQVSGTEGQSQERTIKLTREYLSSGTIWPQHNLLLLSKAKLADYLKQKDIEIFLVDKIKKNYFNTIEITVVPRVESYIIDTPNTRIVLYQDGIVSQSNAPIPSSTIPTNLTYIKVDALENSEVGKTALEPSTLNSITAIKSMFAQSLPLPIAYFHMGSPSSLDIEVYTANGVKIIFDRNPDFEKLSKQLPLLWSNLNDTQKKNVYYIDMRMPDRGFTCLKNTPCTIDYKTEISTSTLNTITSTTSPTSTLPVIQK